MVIPILLMKPRNTKKSRRISKKKGSNTKKKEEMLRIKRKN